METDPVSWVALFGYILLGAIATSVIILLWEAVKDGIRSHNIHFSELADLPPGGVDIDNAAVRGKAIAPEDLPICGTCGEVYDASETMGVSQRKQECGECWRQRCNIKARVPVGAWRKKW